MPQLALDFAKKIDEGDLLIISLAEKNGVYSTAFKNIYNWISVIPGRKAFGDKHAFVLATLPERRDGAGPWQNRYSKPGITAQWNSH